jgi:hypothetical protein
MFELVRIRLFDRFLWLRCKTGFRSQEGLNYWKDRLAFRKELDLSKAITLSSFILLVKCPFFLIKQEDLENSLQLWQYAKVLRRSILNRSKD